MKAFLLAAGTGSRLRPLTDTTPKCLLPIDGQTLLDRWLDALARAGVDEVLVNLHHFADRVEQHLAHRAAPPAVRTAFEPALLGSAGTLVANRSWVDAEAMFLACYVDNVTDFDLRELIECHDLGRSVATMAVFRAEDPSACGVVETDGAGRVVGFVEKPLRPAGNLANGGIYALDPSVLDEIDGAPPQDIGYHLLPKLVGRARAIEVRGYFRDIGTPDAYRQAQIDRVEAARR